MTPHLRHQPASCVETLKAQRGVAILTHALSHNNCRYIQEEKNADRNPEPRPKTRTREPRPGTETSKPDPRADTRNPRAETQNPDPRAETPNPDPRAESRDPKLGPESRNPEPQTRTREPRPGTETPNPDPRAETLYINIYKPEGGTQGGSYAFARFEPKPAYAFQTAGSSNMVVH